MHELAITESIVTAVTDRMADTPIRRVRVEVGRLSGVVPDALRFCFELATVGSTLAGAELEIISVPGRGRCRECSAEFDTDEIVTACACGSLDVQVTGGQQLLIREVEVV